jgi:S-adenosylmethionine decarboxylase
LFRCQATTPDFNFKYLSLALGRIQETVSGYSNQLESILIIYLPFLILSDGAAYSMGAINRDCWYLYTLNPLSGPMIRNSGPVEPDQTLEVLMTHLDPTIMSIFTKEVCKSGEEATVVTRHLVFVPLPSPSISTNITMLCTYIFQKSGIDRIIPNAVINEHLFDPCGYSMNGIFKNVSYLNFKPIISPSLIHELIDLLPR